ncbi:MAG: very short patch repair endonuclease [Pseudomonadota bacterium]
MTCKRISCSIRLMADVFSPEKRSSIMSKVKGANTRPELLVRSILHRMGFRFRLHRKDLPGRPDIVLPRLRKVIFVHGCFWHGHEGCPRAARPACNQEFWDRKLSGNLERDRRNMAELKALGWDPLILWTCETRDPKRVEELLTRFLAPVDNSDG